MAQVVAFSPDGKILASAGKAGGRTVLLWNPLTGKQVGSLESNIEWDAERDLFLGIGRIVFSDDGKNLAVGSRMRKGLSPWTTDTIVLWDIAAAKEMRSFVRGTNGHYASEAFGLSRDGKLIAAPSLEGPVHLWDTTTGKSVVRSPTTQKGSYGVTFSPDGKLLACADSKDAIHLWDPLTGQEVRPINVPVKGATSVVISSDGRIAASFIRLEGVVRLWATDTGKPIGVIQFDQAIDMITMAPGKSPRVIIQGCSGKTSLVSYDIATKTQHQLSRRGTAVRLAFADGDRLLFRGEWDGKLSVREAATDKELCLFWGHFNNGGVGVHTLVPSADGKVLASAGIGGVKVWDVDARREQPAFRDKKIAGDHVALTPDGRILAAHDMSDTVHFWDIATGRKLRTSPGRKGLPTALTFAPDGRTLAEGRTDGTIRILETATGGERRILSGHRGEITSLAWSADSRILISASHDTTALVWDATGLSSDHPSAKKVTR